MNFSAGRFFLDIFVYNNFVIWHFQICIYCILAILSFHIPFFPLSCISINPAPPIVFPDTCLLVLFCGLFSLAMDISVVSRLELFIGSNLLQWSWWRHQWVFLSLNLSVANHLTARNKDPKALPLPCLTVDVPVLV